MKRTAFVFCALMMAIVNLSAQPGDFPRLTGPYLGQRRPGMTAEIFAPGVVSTGMTERALAISADGREIYFEVMFGRLATIMVTKIVGGRWSEPTVAPFAADLKYFNLEPCLAADDRKILFLSNRPRPGDAPKPGWAYQHIWAADRKEDGQWGEPYALGAPINSSEGAFYPSLADNGTLYFSRSTTSGEKSAIWRSRWLGGEFQPPELLPEAVNGKGIPYNAFIARDESYLIACVNGREDSLSAGTANYYIFFRSADDRWSAGINLGAEVNFAGGSANAPYVTRDGKYFFFGSPKAKTLPTPGKPVTAKMLLEYFNGPQNGGSDVYWRNASFLEKLHPREVK